MASAYFIEGMKVEREGRYREASMEGSESVFCLIYCPKLTHNIESLLIKRDLNKKF
jgi:hypothetical protein